MVRTISSQHEVEFCRAYELYARRVRQYIARRVPLHDVDDVLADVFVVLWRKRGSVQWDTNLEWWLLRVAYRCVGGVYRSKRRRDALVEKIRLEPVEYEDQDALARTTLSVELVRRGLLELGAKDREALRLWAWEELSAGDASYVLGVTPSAYEKRLQRAKQRFSEALDHMSETAEGRTLIDRRAL